MSCITHCCPKCGCKYGKLTCTVLLGFDEPYFPPNNGCEYCEEEVNSLVGSEVYLWWDDIYSSLAAIEKQHGATTVFKTKDNELWAITYSPIDEQYVGGAALVINGWCNLREVELKVIK